MKQIKEDTQREIKRIEDFLNEEENVGVINNNIIFHRGMLQGYQNTLNEINELLKHSNK
jgi:hypothetical protein